MKNQNEKELFAGNSQNPDCSIEHPLDRECTPADNYIFHNEYNNIVILIIICPSVMGWHSLLANEVRIVFDCLTRSKKHVGFQQ